MGEMALNTIAAGGSVLLDPTWFCESTTVTCFADPRTHATSEIADWIERIDVALVGSGGVISIPNLWSDRALSPVDFLFFEPSPEGQLAVTKTAPEMITFIRASLGISIVDLASSLKATRQTVYDWMDGQVPRGDNLRRIDHLYRLAEHWNSLCPWPTRKHIQHVVDKGKSLCDLLSAEVVDDQRVRASMGQLAAIVTKAYSTQKRTSIAERLRAKGVARVSDGDFAVNLNAVNPPGDLPDPDPDVG